jgi:hypothetical protein
MREIYVVRSETACCNGGIVAAFATRLEAEAHLRDLSGIGWSGYEVAPLPFYDESAPKKTVWYRAGAQFGSSAEWHGPGYERIHWDWQYDPPLTPEDDGVLKGGTNSSRFPYFYCESYDKTTAERVVRDAIDSYTVPA